MRNIAVFLLLSLITYTAILAISLLVGVLLGLTAAAFGPSRIAEIALVLVVTAISSLSMIPPTLLYLDMRARKEGLDRTRLLEELRV